MNTDNDLNEIKRICSQLKAAVPGPNPWRWDEEFDVARIVFRKSDEQVVLPLLEKAFQNRFDFSTIEKSSSHINQFITSLFGIIPGQMVFSSDITNGHILFAAWWPWGNEMYISLRVGFHAVLDCTADKTALRNHLSEWFNLKI